MSNKTNNTKFAPVAPQFRVKYALQVADTGADGGTRVANIEIDRGFPSCQSRSRRRVVGVFWALGGFAQRFWIEHVRLRSIGRTFVGIWISVRAPSDRRFRGDDALAR